MYVEIFVGSNTRMSIKSYGSKEESLIYDLFIFGFSV
jgi:hypothetical protein